MSIKPKKSLYEKPKYKYLAKIVRFDTPERARGSIEKLTNEFVNARTLTKKLRIAKASMYASNRAEASGKKKNLSRKEKSEYKKISMLYRGNAHMLFKEYNSLKEEKKK